MTTSSLDDVFSFLRTTIPLSANKMLVAESDIQKDFGVDGDDFDDLMEQYANRFGVDLSNYIWYFHQNDEGALISLSSFIFKPPSQQVTRIPITPLLLLECANAGGWVVEYPVHTPPKHPGIMWEAGFYLIILAVIAIIGYLA